MKCVRCERSCYASDKFVKCGVICCTDCACEVVNLPHETIRVAVLKFKDVHITKFVSNKKSHIIMTIDGNYKLDATVEYWETCETGTPRLCITDNKKEGNFAIMYPKAGKMNSLRACVRLCMNEILEHV